MKTDFEGLPLDFHLTGGEASDSRQFETMPSLGPDIEPRAVMTDKGSDAKSNRETARRRGIRPIIPYRSHAKEHPAFFPKRLYRRWARIEQTIGKVKRFERVAPRCEKTAPRPAIAVRKMPPSG